MSMKRSVTSIACCAALVAAFGGAAFFSASAQPVNDSAATSAAPVYLASAAEPSIDALPYSSSAGAAELDAAEHYLSPNGMMQPPPRRYGRPTYHDSHSNADGSSKFAFVAGAGFTQPLGNTFHYFNPSFGVQIGGGRNFNKNFGVLMQFDYDAFGLNGRTITNQSTVYDPNNIYGVEGSLDANAHVWSVTLNPIYTVFSGEGLGAYVVAGAGFYHKVTNFTLPQEEEYCSYYYGCEAYEANATFDHYTSNAPGANAGFGFTYKFSRFASERLFGEVRYVFIDNSQRKGVNINNYTTASATATNYFPANSNRTTYIPVKVGIRF